MSTAYEKLVEAREQVEKDRVYGSFNSSSTFKNAYSAAESYIRELEKKVEVYEHQHQWSQEWSMADGGASVRKCECGGMQMWYAGAWHDLTLTADW